MTASGIASGLAIACVAISGCGRLRFEEADETCDLQMLDDSFDAEIMAWNADANEDVLTAVVAYDASCAPDVDWVAAHVMTPAPRGMVTEVDLDWSGALGSFFFSTNASREGPMLATSIDSFLGAGGTAIARHRVDRLTSGDLEHRLIVFSVSSGLVVVLDGRKPEEND